MFFFTMQYDDVVLAKKHSRALLCARSPANHSIGERDCVCGPRCLAMFIARVRYGPDNTKGFVCKEFLLPEQYLDFLDGKGCPSQRQKCLLCARYWTTYIYILVRLHAHAMPAHTHTSHANGWTGRDLCFLARSTVRRRAPTRALRRYHASRFRRSATPSVPDCQTTTRSCAQPRPLPHTPAWCHARKDTNHTQCSLLTKALPTIGRSARRRLVHSLSVPWCASAQRITAT